MTTIKSMRQWLQTLEQDQILKTVSRKVSLRHELAAVGKKADGQWAVRFNHPDDFDLPIVAGLTSSRAWIAKAMGVPESCVYPWGRQHPSGGLF